MLLTEYNNNNTGPPYTLSPASSLTLNIHACWASCSTDPISVYRRVLMTKRRESCLKPIITGKEKMGRGNLKPFNYPEHTRTYGLDPASKSCWAPIFVDLDLHNLHHTLYRNRHWLLPCTSISSIVASSTGTLNLDSPTYYLLNTMSQAVLMKEYKDLSKEKWLQIEVSTVRSRTYQNWDWPTSAEQRQHLLLEHCVDSPQSRLSILWRILPGRHDLSTRLPFQTTR